MTISEMIHRLEEMKSIYGDIEMVVKYRDDGGEYEGYDKDVYMTVENVDDKTVICM